MAKRPINTAPLERALLLTPRDQARAQLLSRVELGEIFLGNSQPTTGSLEELSEKFQRWSAYNAELLSRMFTTAEYQQSYISASPMAFISMGVEAYHERLNRFHDRVRYKVNNLLSLAERLDLIEEAAGVQRPNAPALERPSVDTSNNKVFVVHGQDEETKSIVARFLEHCGLQPVVLHEQADRGRTIIEKFEEEADVGFAVVLLTPDDVGGRAASILPPESGELQPRARQNVVLELGYFIGRLSRSRVCALRRGEVELPSDFSGVIYTPLDAGEGWKVKLAKELRAAGYEIDLNRALV